jgi:hypothetical protein
MVRQALYDLEAAGAQAAAIAYPSRAPRELGHPE